VTEWNVLRRRVAEGCGQWPVLPDYGQQILVAYGESPLSLKYTVGDFAADREGEFFRILGAARFMSPFFRYQFITTLAIFAWQPIQECMIPEWDEPGEPLPVRQIRRGG